MNLDTLPPELLLARGQYATVRSAHEDEKKRLQVLCGGLGATAAQILRAMQPDHDAIPDAQAVDGLLAACRKAVDDIDACCASIDVLAAQRAALKPAAWPKR
jgi:hypothetical protein